MRRLAAERPPKTSSRPRRHVTLFKVAILRDFRHPSQCPAARQRISLNRRSDVRVVDQPDRAAEYRALLRERRRPTLRIERGVVGTWPLRPRIEFVATTTAMPACPWRTRRSGARCSTAIRRPARWTRRSTRVRRRQKRGPPPTGAGLAMGPPGAWDVTSSRSHRRGPPGPLERSFRPRHDPYSTQISSASKQIGLQCRETGVMLEQKGPAMEPREGHMGNVGCERSLRRAWGVCESPSRRVGDPRRDRTTVSPEDVSGRSHS